MNIKDFLRDAFITEQDQEKLPVYFVRTGGIILASAVAAALKPPALVVSAQQNLQLAFYCALLLLGIFGILLVSLGWMVSDNPTKYNFITKAAVRVSHIALAIAIGLRL